MNNGKLKVDGRGIGFTVTNFEPPKTATAMLNDLRSLPNIETVIREAHFNSKKLRQGIKIRQVHIDSVCGEVWGVEGVVEGESATALLQRLDAGFHARVEQVIKDSPHLCVNRNSDEWPGDFMRTLQGQVMDYLNEHPIRKQALELAAMEYVLPPIVMSREEFERTYIGTFIRDGSKCKCGTSWDAMLYGAECGRCGEKRPVPHGAPCAVSDDPISAVAIAFLDGRV